MSKISNIIYISIINLYRFLPYKKLFCTIGKKVNFTRKVLYKDFKFKGRFRVKTDSGKFFFIYHHGGTIENETYWNGLFTSWENEVGWLWQQLCKCSDVVFDIGANTGIYSLLAKCINPSAEVHAFEPSVNTYEKLLLNNKINNYDIRCMQIALSNINGEQVFYDTPDTNQTSASLSRKKLKDFEYYKGDIKEYNVNTLTLSSYIEMWHIPKIDLIKMDVEMHEPEVIEGFGKYLHLFKPIVIVEVLNNEIANNLNKLIGDDYICLHLLEKGIVEHRTKIEFVYGKWNYVFFHKEMKDKVKQNTTMIW